MVPTLANALNTAISGVPGPVFVELPIDLLYPEEDIRKEFMNQLPKSGFVGKIAHWYVNRHLSEIKKAKRNENLILPKDVNFVKIPGLSNEAKEKLSFVKPETLGQAMLYDGFRHHQ